MKKYKDLFVDFDDTLYDTHGNAEIALRETFDTFKLAQYFEEPQRFYDTYWAANIDLWTRYSKEEITRDYLIVERFRRPLSEGRGLDVTEQMCLEMNDVFLDYCSNKPGVVEGAHEIMDYLRAKGYRMHMTILSEDAGANKPSKAFFDYAFSKTGANPETTMMIGDNMQTDIKGAMAAGLDTILFNRWGYDIKSGDPEAPTYIVSKLLDIKQII